MINNFMKISEMKIPAPSIVWEAKLKYMGTKKIKIKLLQEKLGEKKGNFSTIAVLYNK